jgi:hypothetical protein
MFASLRLAMLILVGTLAFVDRAGACDCLGTGTCGVSNIGSQYWDADEVFVGVAGVKAPVPQSPPVHSSRAVFTIEVSYKGQARGTITVGPTDRISDCDYWFTDGVRYLVLARRTPDGQFEVSRCGRTVPADDADDALAIIRAIARGDIVVGRIAGAVQMGERLSAREGLIGGLPVPGATVTLRQANGSLLSVETSADGRYVFESVPPGTYAVTVRTTASQVPVALGATVTVPGAGACVLHRIGLLRSP